MIDQLVPYEGQLKIHDEKPGAYVIFHEATGRVYVGSSGKPGYRLSRHKTLLKGKRHDNPRFQELYDACDRLRHTVYLVADRDAAYELEQALIDYYNERGLLTNIGLDAKASNRGRVASDSTRAKQSVAKLGKQLSDETRQRMSEGALAAGWVRTSEQREHLSQLKKGKPQPEHIRKLLLERISARMRPVRIGDIVYATTIDAGKGLGLSRETIGNRVRSTSPKWKEYSYT